MILQYNILKNTGSIFIACILMFIILFLHSCKKDEPEISFVDCTPIPPYTDVGFGYNYIIDTIYYTCPSFNPNNPEEFVYIHKNYSSNTYRLFKYNYQTKEKTLIYTGDIYFQPKWGKNDWILLNLPDANIWRIKSNGDSLTKLTSTGGFYQPEWDKDNQKIVFYESFNNMNYFIINFNGQFLDSFPNNLPAPMKWYNDSLIYYHSFYKIYCLNIYAHSLNVIYEYSETGVENCSLVFTKNNELIFCKSDGIYSLNLLTHNLKMLKSTCNSKVYCFPTYSSLLDKVIWQRMDYTLIDKQNVFVKSRLFIMNSDGSNESEIIID